MNIGQLLCGKVLGHKWRRPTKKERNLPERIGQILPSNHPLRRICRHCGAERIAKARRKANPKQTQEQT